VSLAIRRVEYFRIVVQDRPGEAYQLLSNLAGAGVNMLAFNAVPLDAAHTQLILFPEDGAQLGETSDRLGLELDGPHPAILIQGDDRLGALCDIHAQLFDADVNVFSSNGVADGRGGFGYVVYLRPENMEAAGRALGL
jgi:hypothetical protein